MLPAGFNFSLFYLAVKGVEPPTYSLEGCCSNPLNYTVIKKSFAILCKIPNAAYGAIQPLLRLKCAREPSTLEKHKTAIVKNLELSYKCQKY